MSADHQAHPYLNSPVDEHDGRISPDGHWVAYVSDESSRNEVLVQSFPVLGNKRRISTNGGSNPVWRQDGRELYFLSDDQTLMAVKVTPSAPAPGFSTPTRLFQRKDIVISGGREIYAPSRDGQRFLILVPVEDDRAKAIQLITNWKP